MSPERTVLVVDDDADVLALVAEIVGEIGCRVCTAANGEEALARFGAEPAEVVLTDVRMPVVDGVALSRALKRRSPAPEILVMTAYMDLETAIEAVRLGAFEYLLKPVDVEVLRQAVRQALERHRLTTENRALLEDLARTNQALRETQAQLVEKERLAAVGQLAVGLSHAVLNPLTGIVGALEVLKSTPLTAVVRAEVCDQAKREAARIEAVIRKASTLRCTGSTPYVGDVRMLELEVSCQRRSRPAEDGARV